MPELPVTPDGHSAEEWRQVRLVAEIERLRTNANSARVLIERHRARYGSNDLLTTALRELDEALDA